MVILGTPIAAPASHPWPPGSLRQVWLIAQSLIAASGGNRRDAERALSVIITTVVSPGMDGKLAEGLASDVMELAGTPPKVPPTLAVRMPALGEGVAEGTVTRWLKQVGDTVAVDEPLVEVSTDKVDTEIPAPADGILLEIAAPLDSVVKVGSTLGVLVGQRSADSPGQMPGVQISMANRLARSTNPDQTIARAKALLDQHALSQAEFDLLKSHALSAWLQTLG